MRLCVVTLDFRPFRTSGLAVYGELLTHGCIERGHQVTVITSRHSKSLAFERLDGVDIHRISTYRLDWFGLGWQASRLAERLHARARYDCIHFLDVHFGYASNVPFVATAFQSFRQRLTADRGLPYHTSPANLLYRGAYYNMARFALERPAVQRAKHLIMPSQATYDEFHRQYAVPRPKMSLIPLGIDLKHFSRRDGQALCDRLGLRGKFIILHVGFASPRKGLETAAKALQYLPESCVIVQVGKWDETYRTRVYQAAGPAKHRFIEAGYVPDTDIPAYYSMADVAIFPSWLEGFGMPPVEAMACETPVIVSDAGSLPEIVGEAGIIVPPGDERALADAILMCLSDPSYARRLGCQGRKRAESRFELSRMVDMTLKVLAEHSTG
jgi:glycosyltransferase involved in cell wall biosynthesis